MAMASARVASISSEIHQPGTAQPVARSSSQALPGTIRKPSDPNPSWSTAMPAARSMPMMMAWRTFTLSRGALRRFNHRVW